MDNSLTEVAAAKPSAYLTKPVTKHGLYIAINNAIDKFLERQESAFNDESTANESFFSKKGKKYVKVFWNDVVSLRSDAKYTVLEVAAARRAFIYVAPLQNTLKHIVRIAEDYVQIRRGQYISIHHIAEVTGDTII